MIAPQALFDLLKANKIGFFTGVPDSLLQSFCAYVTDHTDPSEHIIVANEGGAVALAAGHYLSTGNIPLVYMQNSGQGNAVNPLTSLTDPDVYSIPTLLLIGWRGEPGVKDEPQHVKQGKITLKLLETLGISYSILPDTESELAQTLATAIASMHSRQGPYALVVKKNTFEPYTLQKTLSSSYTLTREQALTAVVNKVHKNDVIVSTTGKLSRELFEHREQKKQGHHQDFLTVGSMGHASQIALGVALQQPNRTVYCFDGDGAALMHLGGMAIIGQQKSKNFKHIIFNNGVHDSVGGQPTAGFCVDFCAIAEACGYTKTFVATTEEELSKTMEQLQATEGPVLLEIKVATGSRKDLGRPTTTPQENKDAFMQHLKNVL